MTTTNEMLVAALNAVAAAMTKDAEEKVSAVAAQALDAIKEQKEATKTAVDEAVQEAVQALDFEDAVTEAIEKADCDAAIEHALESYDFSDAVASAVEDYDFSKAAQESVQECIDNGALDDTIKERVEKEVESTVAEAVESAVESSIESIQKEQTREVSRVEEVADEAKNEAERATSAIEDAQGDIDALRERCEKLEAQVAQFAKLTPFFEALLVANDKMVEARVAEAVESLGGKHEHALTAEQVAFVESAREATAILDEQASDERSDAGIKRAQQEEAPVAITAHGCP